MEANGGSKGEVDGKPAKYQVPAVVGAIRVMHELAGSGEAGATQAELVKATGLSKSTMHNLLATLENHDFVRREADSRSYRLGPALIPLGTEASRQVRLVRTTIDRVAPLAGEYHLSFAVAQMVNSEECRIIERFYPIDDVHVGITVGSGYGPMDGALGKILLAFMDPSRANRMIKSRRLPAHTDATITSPESLIEDVEQARVRGWAVSAGELNQNHAVAAGVRAQNGNLGLLLLALGFPADLDDARMTEIGQLLADMAASIMAEAGIATSAEA
jgi:DNA-binding IclR family transcriptional regulator